MELACDATSHTQNKQTKKNYGNSTSAPGYRELREGLPVLANENIVYSVKFKFCTGLYLH